jgi:hypothetical protein
VGKKHWKFVNYKKFSIKIMNKEKRMIAPFCRDIQNMDLAAIDGWMAVRRESSISSASLTGGRHGCSAAVTEPMPHQNATKLTRQQTAVVSCPLSLPSCLNGLLCISMKLASLHA